MHFSGVNKNISKKYYYSQLNVLQLAEVETVVARKIAPGSSTSSIPCNAPNIIYGRVNMGEHQISDGRKAWVPGMACFVNIFLVPLHNLVSAYFPALSTTVSVRLPEGMWLGDLCAVILTSTWRGAAGCVYMGWVGERERLRGTFLNGGIYLLTLSSVCMYSSVVFVMPMSLNAYTIPNS